MTTNATAAYTAADAEKDAQVADLEGALRDALGELFDDGRMNDVLFEMMTKKTFEQGDDFTAADLLAVQNALHTVTHERDDAPLCEAPAAAKLVRTVLGVKAAAADAFDTAHTAAVVYLNA